MASSIAANPLVTPSFLPRYADIKVTPPPPPYLLPLLPRTPPTLPFRQSTLSRA